MIYSSFANFFTDFWSKRLVYEDLNEYQLDLEIKAEFENQRHYTYLE